MIYEVLSLQRQSDLDKIPRSPTGGGPLSPTEEEEPEEGKQSQLVCYVVVKSSQFIMTTQQSIYATVPSVLLKLSVKLHLSVPVSN